MTVVLIPIAALAGVLLATEVQMIEVSSVAALIRSTRGDAVVLVLTAVATVAAHRFLLELSEVSAMRVVVLRMSRITTMDATGASVLADTIKRLEARGITVLLSNIRPEHAALLSRLGVYDELAHERHVFPGTPEAIVHARVHAAREAHEPSV